MRRRKFTIGLGALAAGSAAAVGTGAFSTVEADRTVSLNIEGDSDAYLQITPRSEATFAEEDGDGLIQFNFDGSSDADGSGLNANADTEFGPEFEISNQGTDPVLVTIDPSDVDAALGGGGSLSFFVYSQETDGAEATLESTDQNNPGRSGVILESGTSVPVTGLFRDVDPSDITATIADASLSIFAVSDNSEQYPDGGPSDNSAGLRAKDDSSYEDTG